MSDQRRDDMAALHKDGRLNLAELEKRAKVLEGGPRVCTHQGMVRHLLTRRPAAPGAAKPGCPTGIGALDDEAGGGIQPGHVWLIGADTSWGKSSLAIAIVDETMKAGKSALIVSLEDVEELYGDRFAARRLNIAANDIRDGKFTSDERARIADYVSTSGNRQPAFIKADGETTETIVGVLRVLLAEYKIDLVVIDYVQELYMSKATDNRRLELAAAVGIIMTAIKDAGASGLLLSQLTMPEGKRRPDRHAIRDCRDIANKAEGVLIGFYGDKDEKVLLVDKLKNGKRGWAKVLDWDERTASFRPQPTEEQAQRATAAAFTDDDFDDASTMGEPWRA